jgi:hypothetical protein
MPVRAHLEHEATALSRRPGRGAINEDDLAGHQDRLPLPRRWVVRTLPVLDDLQYLPLEPERRMPDLLGLAPGAAGN